MKFFVYGYLIIGFIYAMYILLFAGDGWAALPINMLFGPVYIVWEIFKAITYKGKPTFKEIFKNKKVVVFDLDGTLVDTPKYWKESFLKVGIENDLNLSVNLKKGAGLEEKWTVALEEGGSRVAGEVVKDLVSLTKEYFLELMPEQMEPMEGFWSLARELKEEKKVKLVLTSNSDREIVDEVLKRLNMENVFDFVIGGDEVKNKKPNPEIYKAIVKEFKVKPKHVLVFEDSPVGSQASVKAGMDTIIIWDTKKMREIYPKRAKLYVPDFSPFLGNFDKTYKEMIEESAEFVQEYDINF